MVRCVGPHMTHSRLLYVEDVEDIEEDKNFEQDHEEAAKLISTKKGNLKPLQSQKAAQS